MYLINFYIVLLDGVPCRSLHPSRIRQGDPLSPYVFILMGEILSRLSLLEESTGHLEVITIARTAPPLTHLMYADESIWGWVRFIRESPQGLSIHHSTTHQFQQIKYYLAKRKVLIRKSGMNPILEGISYLGLSIIQGRQKIKCFQFLIQTIRTKISGWKWHNISTAGRTYLIQSVANIMANYVMSCCSLPKQIIKRINLQQAKFWWQKEINNFRRFIGWDKICRPKEFGGLGIRNISVMISLHGESLPVRTPSYQRYLEQNLTIQNLWVTSSLLLKLIILLVLKGYKESTFVKWVLETRLNCVWILGVSTLSKYIPRLNPRYQNLAHLPVSYLTLPRFTRWNVNKIRQTFRPEDVHQILLLPPPSNDREDSSLWLPANNGVFLNL